MATQAWPWHPTARVRACLVSFAAVLWFGSAATAQSLELASVERAIRQSAQYLLDQAQPHGQFVYRVNTNPQVLVRPKYNMLRHAGAMVALAEYQRAYPSPAVTQVLQSANAFLKTQIKPLDDVPGTLAVWSDRAVNHSDDPLKAKLGGAGLGLVAMCELEKMAPGSTAKEWLEDLGNFILFMQKDDGSFYSIYYPIFPGRDDQWTSLYYPGEAALGLLTLNEILPQADWVRGAKEALLFLAHERRGQPEVPADHWALIATEKLLSHSAELSLAERSLLRQHVRQIVNFMLEQQAGQDGHERLDGCFVADGRTTPTATRLEGLLAAARILPRDDRLQARLRDAIQRGVQFLLRAQVKSGKFAGGMPRAIEPLTGDPSKSMREFNARATEIRIDYVQHALSVFLGVRRSLADEAPP